MKIVAIWAYRKLSVNKKVTSLDPSAVKKKKKQAEFIIS